MAAKPAQQVQAGGEDRLDKLRRNLGKIVVVPLAELVIEGNVRQEVDTVENEFRQLVESIRHHGVLQNLVVNLQMRGINTYRLVVVAGQRRFLAAKEAGLSHAPALLMEYKTAGSAKADGLRENLLRKDLYCLDVAEAYLALIEDGWDEQGIAREFEREPRTIRRYLALARYPTELKDLIRQHKEVFTARLLLREIGGRHYASQEGLEQAVKAKINLTQKQSVSPKLQDAGWKDTEKRLKTHLGLQTKLSGSTEKGRVTIAFRNKEEWNTLITKLLPGK